MSMQLEVLCGLGSCESAMGVMHLSLLVCC